ncbi:MAG: wax ester/triacylglycerol synthase domain-containing protein, partial [Thermoleophilaceae bacterium]
MPDESLNALDATFLELEEANQSAHMHIGAVLVFEVPSGERPPTLERLRTDLNRRLAGLPRYHQRLSEPRTGGLRWPRWLDDERFDIAHHVRAAALPPPAGEAELREWAGEYFSQRLDRARPLWEIVLVELADARWAMVTKTHHCIVDGVGSLDIGQTILDLEADPVSKEFACGGRRAAGPPTFSEAGSGTRGVAALPLSAGLRIAAIGADVVRGAVGLAGAAADAVIHPQRGRDALRRSRALAEVLIHDELIAAPATSLNEPIGAARTLAVIEVPLDELKEIKRSLGGTVNDVVLAVTAGGLRRLFEHRGEALPRAGV